MEIRLGDEVIKFEVNEQIRQKLLEEERKLRAKQPEPWTKTKFRRYANFGKIKA
ncbi:MAG: hypothetical protein J7L44_02290 [Candidatus Diapherotrites archaeon]|jgi:hypothetical protein|nr:hypothetical protein [Candidatus Diapherotrites archaeon]